MIVHNNWQWVIYILLQFFFSYLLSFLASLFQLLSLLYPFFLFYNFCHLILCSSCSSLVLYCQAQIQLVSIAKLSWVSTIIALHNHHHHHTQPPPGKYPNTTCNPLRRLKDLWNKKIFPPPKKKKNTNLFDQPKTAQLNLSWAWHSSALACFSLLMFTLLLCV